MKPLYFLLLLFFITSCYNNSNTNYVKSKVWSYDRGFKLGKGDFITFDTSRIFELRGDTIFYQGKPGARIQNIDRKNFVMNLRSLDGKQDGTYRNVEESLQ